MLHGLTARAVGLAAGSPLARSRRFSRAVGVLPYSGPLTRLGSDYGGWTVPVDLVRPGSLCYTAGAGTDITFDVALLEFGCTVHAFDPTPSSIEHVRTQRLDTTPAFHFHPWAIWTRDGELRLYAPQIGDSNYSAADLQRTGRGIVVPCRSLTSIASELGHERIDLLKLDIEGAEYEVLGALLASDLRPRVLAVEFHKTPSIRPMVTTSRALRADGYVPVALRGFDVTFVRDAAP